LRDYGSQPHLHILYAADGTRSTTAVHVQLYMYVGGMQLCLHAWESTGIFPGVVQYCSGDYLYKFMARGLAKGLKTGASISLRPWCISPLFQISPPIFEKFSDSAEHFLSWFSSAKIS